MITCVAVDDEPIALQILTEMAGTMPALNLVTTFSSALQARTYLHENAVDLLFLDIRMPDLSGLDLLASLRNPPMVIFTTAYSEHAVTSYELSAIDYLMKPFSQKRFTEACNKAMQHLEHLNGTRVITVKSGWEKVRIGLSEILYVESVGNYVQFNLEGRTVMARMTMSDVLQILPPSDFLRIHRSYIVSLKKVSKMSRTTVSISNKQLPRGEGFYG